MIVPVLLLLFALLSAVVFAYGTEAVWASYGPRGLELILWSRRLEWPLMVATLLLCVGLIGIVISAKKQAWWLLGLIPVLALFYHRFTDGPAAGLGCVQDPPFARLSDGFPQPGDLVVGFVLDSQPYAFAYSMLDRDPVVVATLRDQRIILLWSEYANRALAFTADRDLRAEDLEVVSTPDNALLVYNTRLGEFINGITGETTRGGKPSGFRDWIPVVKTVWKAWTAAHPGTMVAFDMSETVTQPDQPRYALPGTDPSLSDTRRVCMVAATQPIAVPSESITDRPLNLTSGQTSLLLVRIDGVVHAFNRELPGDLIPRFAPGSDPKHKTVAWVDSDTNSQWSTTGAVVEGPPEMHGLSMASLPVEDGLYWNVMKFWYPQLHLATDAEIVAATVVKSARTIEKPAGKRRKKSHG